MTQNEVDIMLQAIRGVRDDIHELDSKFETFRTYADLTYVRKETVQERKEAHENIWKRRDRILARVAVFLSAAAILVSVLLTTLHK